MDSITKALARSFGSNPSAGPAPGEAAAQVDSEALTDAAELDEEEEAAQTAADAEEEIDEADLAQTTSEMRANLSHLTGIGADPID